MALSATEQARLVLGWGHRPKDLRTYGVTDGTRTPRDAEGLLSHTWLAEQVHPALNARPAQVLTGNKWVFYRLMAASGVPIPHTLGLYDPVHGLSWDGRRRLRTADDVLAEVDRVRPDGLVLKPAGGQQGKGLLILDQIDHASGRATTRTGRVTTLAAAVAEVDVAGMGDAPGYIVQVPVPSHPEYQRLAPWTTNTIRVVTLADLAGEVQVQAAVTILGRRGTMANNWHAGGVNVGVDITTGVMGRGNLFGESRWLTEHPDTGEPFGGTVVPDWDRILQVCRSAAVLLPGIRSIGWDVVATPTGPVVLEGNSGWDPVLVQVHGRGFVADETIRAQFVAAGAPMPTGPRLGNAVGRTMRRVRSVRRLLPR
ncbi:sugar-transfer associated ATP-grasp domain-containing protein [uncultured Cellulomonas sp.]|uniref:sugar-transfer associated ATP-grasp domain-containing protein n=1 Tax=uncultured Cellulomonas sp. TaxID=189682 RepID=UPI002634B679|nr:sugar-transfer associated ATP-grasp domain-containing protein [uncultured Cellulomonas sp.]